MASSSSSRLDYGDEQMEKRSFTAQLSKSTTTKKSNYGSLRKELSTQQTASAFIVNYKHRLMPGETLQGISLKYGVPMENIKRANRLWSNDLAIIKDTLLIPIDREKLKEMNLVVEEEEPAANKLLNLNDIDVSKTAAAAKEPGEDKEAYKDFLNKFDSFISESKLKLKSLESSSNLAVNDYLNNGYHNYADDEDDTDLFDVKRHLNSKEIDYDPNEPLVGGGGGGAKNSKSSNNRKNNGASMTTASSSSSVLSSNDHARMKNGGGSNSNSSNNLASLPDLIVKSPNSSIHSNTSGGGGQSQNKYMSLNTNSSSSRARMAQETLERLEREKDDLFEL